MMKDTAVNRKTLTVSLAVESDTVYLADRDRYDIYEADTFEGPGISNVGDRVAFCAYGKKNVTLDFAGATLFLHGKIQPFFFGDCENVTVQNVTVEYDRSSVTEGVIVARGEDTIRLKINPRYPYRIEDGQMIPYGETWENREMNRYVMFLTSLDTETGESLGFTLGLIGKDPWVSPDNLWSETCALFDVEDCGNGEILLTVKNKKLKDCFRVGATMVLSHERRTLSSFSCIDCRNVTLRNYRILNGVGMGIMPIHTKNMHVDGLKMFRDERSDGFTTNGADGIHTFSVSGEFLIENSTLEGMVDDALNVHSYFYRIEAIDGDRMTLVFPTKDDVRFTIFAPGERVRVHRGSTLSGATDYLAKAIRVIDLHRIEITLDRPAVGHEPGDAVENPDAVCDLTIRNCRFARSAVSHLRFQNGGKLLVEDCDTTFPFWLTGDMSFWYEATAVPDATFRRCRFIGKRARIESMPEFLPTADAPYYHGRLTVEDCAFETDTPLKLKFSESLVFRNNVNTLGLPMRGELVGCGSYEAEGIEIESVEGKKDSLQMN